VELPVLEASSYLEKNGSWRFPQNFDHYIVYNIEYIIQGRKQVLLMNDVAATSPVFTIELMYLDKRGRD